jgi:thiol-disulfide isomerase/thioredoxin
MGLWWRLLAAGAAAVLLLAACGGADPAGEGGAPGPPVDLDFTVPTVEGTTFDGADLAGQPAVLWFWAPWCVTCAAQAPHVIALAEDYAGRVTVIGVAGLDDSVAAMQQFIDLTGVHDFPHLADSDGVVWQRFEITTQSSFVVLDAQGAVVMRGAKRPAEVADRLDQLVG